MPKLGQIPRDRLPQQRDVEVPPLGRFALVLVQLGVHTSGQFGPVSMQATLPTGRVPRKQPILVAVRSEAVAPFLLSLTSARSLEGKKEKMGTLNLYCLQFSEHSNNPFIQQTRKGRTECTSQAITINA